MPDVASVQVSIWSQRAVPDMLSLGNGKFEMYRNMRRLSGLIAGAGLSLAGLLFASGDAAACGSGKVLFEDNFETIKPSWDFEKEKGRSNGPGGLTYTLEPGKSAGVVDQSGPYTDYEVCALFALDGGKPVPGFVAVRFWFVSPDDEYWAVVFTDDGTSVVNHYVKDHDVVSVMPQITTASGVTDAGLIDVSVVVHGNSGSFSVNGENRGEFTGTPSKQGTRFGFVMRSGKENTDPVAVTLKSIQLRAVEPAKP